MIKHLVDKVLITLEVGERTALLILVARDGSVHRKGNGNPDNAALVLAQGISNLGHFEALMMTNRNSCTLLLKFSFDRF